MLAPPPEHVMRLLGSAAASPAVARRIVNGFNDPTDYANFFMRPDLADAYLAQVAPAEEAAA